MQEGDHYIEAPVMVFERQDYNKIDLNKIYCVTVRIKVEQPKEGSGNACLKATSEVDSEK